MITQGLECVERMVNHTQKQKQKNQKPSKAKNLVDRRILRRVALGMGLRITIILFISVLDKRTISTRRRRLIGRGTNLLIVVTVRCQGR